MSGGNDNHKWLWLSLAGSPLVLCCVGTPVGVVLGLMLRRLLDVPAAVLLGLTTGVLVALAVVVACSPPALRRVLGPVLAAGAGGWLLGWPVRTFSAGYLWAIAAGLGLVVGGGVAGLLVWWRAGRWPYRRPVVLGGLGVLVVLLVAVPVGTIGAMSDAFGTRGDGNPQSAVDSWINSAFPGSIDKPYRDNLARVTCNKPGGRQAMKVFDRYAGYERAHNVLFAATWEPVHSERHGSTATILASVDLTQQLDNAMTLDLGTGAGPWRFTVDDVHGWRVCGLKLPTAPTTETPSPAPS